MYWFNVNGLLMESQKFFGLFSRRKLLTRRNSPGLDRLVLLGIKLLNLVYVPENCLYRKYCDTCFLVKTETILQMYRIL